MKKQLSHFKISLLILALPCLMMSCDKTPQKESPNKCSHKIVAIGDSKQTSSFVCITRIGHEGKNCPGCIVELGRRFHLDCQGDGNVCTLYAQVSLSQIGVAVTATTQDSTALTNEDIFMMPNRSLYAGKDEKGNDLWLNIPEQTSYRDSVTRQFTFTGLYYSNSQVYLNE